MAAKQGIIEFTPEKFYSVEEAAEYLHMTVSTIYKLTSTRQIRFIKPAKKILFRKEYLDEYLESRVFDILPVDQGIRDRVG